MKKLLLTVELEYDDRIMHGDNEQSIQWFRDDILLNPKDDGGLTLHSNEIGDTVGTVKVLKIAEPAKT